MPCPLCLLGFPQPHTKEDWARLEEPEVKERLDKILDEMFPGLSTETDDSERAP